MQSPTVGIYDTDLRAAIDAGDTDRIMEIGAQADALEARLRKPVPSLVSAALFYAQQGLRVFPVQRRSKIPPPGLKWRQEATSDPAVIRRWWTRWPDANIAITTGHLVDVLDIDGPVGVASAIHDLVDDGEWLGPPIIGRVSTPRPGGHHLYMTANPGRHNRTKILPGIDTRGDGGYVLAPPSVAADGGTYRWTTGLTLPKAG